MKLSILTTITNPIERQDQWIEALNNYCELADEVVVMNGGKPIIFYDITLNPKIKIIDLDWPFEWNWVEYPKHLNTGKEHCTGDWILRLDIDQFIHEKDFQNLRERIAKTIIDHNVLTMQKISYTYGGGYYQKGGTEIIVRNIPQIMFGKAIGQDTDLCFPIYVQEYEEVLDENEELVYSLPVGRKVPAERTGVSYHNYDYYFRDMEVTKREFWRASRAWNRYYKNWNFGDSEQRSFDIFCKMIKARHDNSSLFAKPEDHPQYIRQAVKEISSDRLGYNGWGIL